MQRWALMIVAGLSLAGCSKAADPNMVAKEEAAPAAAPGAPIAQPTEQIAYTYSFAFKLPAGRIPDVQARHVALCDRLGPRCRVISMDQAGDSRNAGASMELAVDAKAARSFGAELVASAEREGGETTGRAIQGENLTKQIVDVEARLQGRQALADRLLGVVKTHQGSIADLVTAEKALADVQQEIDTARAELTEARGRVAMSTVRISYAGSASLGGFTAPIAEASGNFGSIAGASVSALLSLLAALLPWLVPAALIVFAVRWWRRRRAQDE
jgi:hypothetical protein